MTFQWELCPFLFIAFFKKAARYKGLFKSYFFDRRHQKRWWISAPLTKLWMLACLYVTLINIITLVKQPGAAQKPLKRKLLERKDETDFFPF